MLSPKTLEEDSSLSLPSSDGCWQSLTFLGSNCYYFSLTLIFLWTVIKIGILHLDNFVHHSNASCVFAHQEVGKKKLQVYCSIGLMVALEGSSCKIGPWNCCFVTKATPGGSDGKVSACNQEMRVQFLGKEDPLEKSMTTHFSSLAQNSMDRGAQWAAIPKVAKSWIRLSLLPDMVDSLNFVFSLILSTAHFTVLSDY